MNTHFVSKSSLRNLPAPRRMGGFTLIELMVTMVVFAILIGLALPSMRNFLIRNKLAAISNEFLGAISMARAEAITRGARVTICRSANTTTAAPTCAGAGTDWENGWIVYVADPLVPNNPSTANTAVYPILKIRNEVDAGFTVIATANNGSLSFGANNGTLIGGPLAWGFQIAPPEGVSAGERHLCIASTGRPRIQDATC